MATISNIDTDLRFYVTPDFDKIFSAKPIVLKNGNMSECVMLTELLSGNDNNDNYPFVGSIILAKPSMLFLDFDSAKLICELNYEQKRFGVYECTINI